MRARVTVRVRVRVRGRLRLGMDFGTGMEEWDCCDVVDVLMRACVCVAGCLGDFR